MKYLKQTCDCGAVEELNKLTNGGLGFPKETVTPVLIKAVESGKCKKCWSNVRLVEVDGP